MELYLLKSATILAILFTFYKLVLENTSVHNFKRFYLFGSLLASFLIPLITFTTYIETSGLLSINSNKPLQLVSGAKKTINYWPLVLWAVYALGVLFFSVKFFRNLFTLIKKIRSNPQYRKGGFINILLNEAVIPHTFFSYIFLNKKQFEKGEIPKEVMLHEQAHAIQKHSLDLIFVELLQIVFWFNPVFYFIKRSIKLNHEFLADRAVLNAGAETSEYQKIVLAFSSTALTPSLAHSLNYSSIKKRFTVMKTHTSKRAILLRSLLILPLLSVLIYGFSSEKIVQKNNATTELTKEKATNAEIAEYNKLAKKYNAIPVEKRIIPLKDLKVLEIIYRKMTEEQKANAARFPECSPTVSAENSKINLNTQPENDSITYFYKNRKITLTEANELLEKNKNLTINVFKEENGKGKVILSEKPILSKKDHLPPSVPKTPSVENGNLYFVPEAPPAPNSNPVKYLKDLAKKGATFYIGPHKYSTEEAIKLAEKSTNDVTIDVSQYPKVLLGGC